MTKPAIYFQDVNERQRVFGRRAFVLGGFAGAGMLALGGRLAQLQLVETEKYQKLSENNQFDFRLTPPPRGLILDRNGVVLASNRPDFRLLVSRDDKTNVEKTVDELSRLVPMDDAHKRRVIAEIKAAPRKAPVPVVEDISWEEFSRINVRARERPNVSADMGGGRVYPFSAAFAHVIRCVAKMTDIAFKKAGP